MKAFQCKYTTGGSVTGTASVHRVGLGKAGPACY